MIVLLTGENSFEIEQELERITKSYEGLIERRDADSVTPADLPEILQGTTLFADKKCVIIRGLSTNKPVWEKLVDYIDTASDQIDLVLIEPKPDKRTRTYKTLQAHADIRVFAAWGEHDRFAATQWVSEQTKERGVKLSGENIQRIIDRTGCDQWRLHFALEKLAALDQITNEIIEDVIELSPGENVFKLIESALKGNTKNIQPTLENLQKSEDPYMAFGLISGQIFLLAALSVSDKSSGEIAKDFGVQPYSMKKMESYAHRLSRGEIRQMISWCAELDKRLKTGSDDPWVLIDLLLQRIALSVK